MSATSQARRLHVAMASYADLAFDSRVQREAIALADAGHRVTLLCIEPGGDLPVSLTSVAKVLARYPHGAPSSSNPFYAHSGRTGPIGRLLDRARWLLRYQREAADWGEWAIRMSGPVDVWHLHDFPALASIAVRLPAGSSFVYDSHELFMETGTAARLPRPLHSILRRRERHLASRTVALVTVNGACSKALASLGAPRTVTVENFPSIGDNALDDGRLRRVAGIPNGAPVVLSHGAMTPQRGLEQLVDAMATPPLADVQLVFLGFGSLGPELLERAATLGIDQRVHVLPAVPPDDVVAWVAGADVCAMLLQPSNLNHMVATPNKLFESLAAGVPVVASDFPGFTAVVREGPDGPLGAVCDPTDVAAIAGAIHQLLSQPPDEREALRARCRHASEERMQWPHAAARLVDLYADLAATPPVGNSESR